MEEIKTVKNMKKHSIYYKYLLLWYNKVHKQNKRDINVTRTHK
jgi:hypothetical protein